MNRTLAGKLELITQLMGGQDILDEYGEPTGEKTSSLISKEEALKLLNSPLEDDNES